MTPAVGLGKALRSMLPADVASAAGWINSAQGSLLPAEEIGTDTMGNKRQKEFRAGRFHAHAALHQLNCEDQPIARANDRRPLWPMGYIGSISHSTKFSAALAASTTTLAGIGLDIEFDRPIDPQTHRFIARPEERVLLREPLQTGLGSLDRAKLLFCSKEALFKAVYPLTLQWFGFQDASIVFAPTTNKFIVHLHNMKRPPLHGRWAWVEDHIAVVVTVPLDWNR